MRFSIAALLASITLASSALAQSSHLPSADMSNAKATAANGATTNTLSTWTSYFNNAAIPSSMQIQQTTDITPIAGLGYAFEATAANKTGILGYLVNNAAPGTFIMPSGVMGVSKIASNAVGNAAWGAYAQAEIDATAGQNIGMEITVRNYCGNPDTNLPPNQGIPTPNCVSNGLQVTGDGTYTNSIGILVGKTGSLTRGFNTAIWLKPDYLATGLYIDAPSSGTYTGEVIANNGNGINLKLNTTSAMQSANAVLVVNDSGGTSHASIRQNGDVYGNAGVFSAGVSGTTGAFTGAVSGTSGTFSSTLKLTNNAHRVMSVADVTAAGITQGTATTLAAELSRVNAGTGGVILVDLGVGLGLSFTVSNVSGASINVYPPVSATIQGLAQNAAYPLANNTTHTFFYTNAGGWAVQ